MEGYQVSAQCMALVRDNCLLPTKDAPELGYVRESTDKQYVPDVFYKVSRKWKNHVGEISFLFLSLFSFISFSFFYFRHSITSSYAGWGWDFPFLWKEFSFYIFIVWIGMRKKVFFVPRLSFLQRECGRKKKSLTSSQKPVFNQTSINNFFGLLIFQIGGENVLNNRIIKMKDMTWIQMGEKKRTAWVERGNYVLLKFGLHWFSLEKFL